MRAKKSSLYIKYEEKDHFIRVEDEVSECVSHEARECFAEHIVAPPAPHVNNIRYADRMNRKTLCPSEVQPKRPVGDEPQNDKWTREKRQQEKEHHHTF